MFFFILGQIAAACPVVQCGTEPIGVCGSRYSTTININYQGCTATTFCELENLFDWYNNGGSYIYCKEFTSVDTSAYADVTCGNRDESTFLLEDIHPKRCNTSDDCILKNSENSPCLCGLDGFSYCQPQWGSEVFDLFWTYCDVYNGTVPYSMWTYWENLQKYYNYYITAPDCAMNIFYELQVLATVPGFGIILRLGLVYALSII